MSKVDGRIHELCPDGVERVALGEVLQNFDRFRKPISRGKRVPGEYPYYGANGVQDYVEDFIFEGEYLLIGEDGSVLTPEGTGVVNWASGKIWVNNHAHVLQTRTDENSLRFFYYLLQTLNIEEFVTGGIQPKLNQKNLNAIPIPLPPLEVQEEIVRILDQFSESVQKLDRELEGEIEGRGTQAEFLRNSYLGSDWQTERLGDLVEYSRKRTKSVELEPGCFTGVENLLQNYAGRIPGEKLPPTESVISYEPGDVLLGNIRPYLKKAWLADQCGGTSNDVLVLSIKDESANQLLATWLYRVIISEDFLEYNVANSRGAKMPRGDKKKIFDYQVPLPPLEVQEEIAQKLDTLDATFTEYIDNLKRERELRRKQYEYYRDRLLDFKVKE